FTVPSLQVKINCCFNNKRLRQSMSQPLKFAYMLLIFVWVTHYFNSLAVFTVVGIVCITSNLDVFFFMFTATDDNSLPTFSIFSLSLLISSLLNSSFYYILPYLFPNYYMLLKFSLSYKIIFCFIT